MRKNKNLTSKRPLTISAQYGLIDQQAFFNKQVASSSLENYLLLEKGEFAYNKSYSNGFPYGTIKKLNLYDNGAVSTLYIAFKANIDINSDFLENLFSSNKWNNEVYKIAAEGARNHGLLNISPDDFFNIKITISKDSQEQVFISKFLRVFNNLLALYERKLKLLSKTKKYFLQKLFANGEQKQPEIRFREFNDNWKEKKLAQLFKISNETNLDNKLYFSKQDVLSVSDKFGVVNQIKLQGRSFAGDNISKYKVVKNNQIVYTKSPLKDKPYGIIKIVSNIKGIVSPLYIVNNVIGNNAWFIYYYFDLKSRTNNYLKPLVRLGAKHTMNITDREWLSGKIFISEVIQEQEKIANLLSTIDKLIRLNEQKLSNLEELKKCLLQNMFC